jgi:hypothetical protein
MSDDLKVILTMLLLLAAIVPTFFIIRSVSFFEEAARRLVGSDASLKALRLVMFGLMGTYLGVLVAAAFVLNR